MESIDAIRCFWTGVGSPFTHGKVYYQGRLLSLLANIGLRWMSMTLTDTLTYYGTKLIAAIKCFCTGVDYPFNPCKVHPQSG
jgi:hypothetical protein